MPQFPMSSDVFEKQKAKFEKITENNALLYIVFRVSEREEVEVAHDAEFEKHASREEAMRAIYNTGSDARYVYESLKYFPQS